MTHKAWVLITLLLALIPEIAIGGNTRVVHADEIIFGDSTTQVTAASPGITSLTGDVTALGVGAVPATVAFVGGAAASAVATATTAANAAASVNTPSTIVRRNSSGNFAAGTITADLVGNVLGSLTGNASGSAASFTGVLAGDVSGTQSGTVVGFVGGSSAASVHSGELAANAATDANTASTIVARDASGNFSASLVHSTTGGFEFPDTTVQTTAATGPTIGGPISGATAGSMLFVGAGPVFAQDNAHLFYDVTNQRLNLGITTPALTSHLSVENTGSEAGITSIQYGAGETNYVAARANGTPGSPTAVLTGNNLANYAGRGYDGAAWSGNASAINMNAEENWAVGAHGSSILFRTTLIGTGTNATRMKIADSGNVGIGTTTPGQKLSVVGLVESTSGGFKFPDATTQTTAAASPAIGNALTGVTTGSVLYGSGGLFAQDNANFFWDGTNHRLGIDTVSPAAALDVAGTIRSTAETAPLTGVGLELRYDGTQGELTAFDRSGNVFKPLFVDGSTLFLNKNSGGPVSINVAVPVVGTAFEVHGTTDITPAMIVSTNSAFPPGIEIRDTASGPGPHRWFIGSGVTSATDGMFRILDYLHVVDRFVIDQTGNVGIATTTPGAKLEVAGSVILSTAATAVTINDTGAHGGNVPHACVLRRSAAGTASIACSAGEIATGGEVNCGSTALFMSDSEFTGGTSGSAPPTGYQGSCTSLLNVVTNTTIVVAANCCIY